ncbi:MAG: leucine-rich repeat protein [Clostridia bacterium]|nr:leucine-rich repeat protein [Clostridia bacterium]
MKNKLTFFIVLALLISSVIVLASCGETPQNIDTSTEDQPDVPTEYVIEKAEGFDFDTDTKKIYKTVSNDIDCVDLSDSFKVTDGATWKLYKDYLGEEEYKLKSMLLSAGENKAYIVVCHPNGEDFTRYELVLYRLDIKEYSFISENQTVQNSTIEELSSVEAPATNPQKTGYDFMGWTVDGDIVSFPYQISVDTVFEAKFTPIEYSITYDFNISGNPETFTIEDLPISLVAPEVGTKQTFAGWCTMYDLSDEPSMQITQIGNVNLYAKIVNSTYGLVFTDNGDTCSVTDYTGTSTNVVIPSFHMGKKVTSIGDSAFYGCESLTSITIPDSVTSIEISAFSDCASLKSIAVNENNSIYESIEGNLYAKNGKILLKYARGKQDAYFTIPNSVIFIGEHAFDNCSLTNVTIGNNVRSIAKSAFYNCNKLESIVIPNSVTSIGRYAFQYCNSLASVTIPNSVTWIDDGAFYGCTSLTCVTIPESVTSIGWYVFSGCNTLTIYCEAESKPDEWSADWNGSDCWVVWGYKIINE